MWLMVVLRNKKVIVYFIAQQNTLGQFTAQQIFDEYIYSRFLGSGMDLRITNCAQTNVQPDMCQIVEAQLPKSNPAEQ